MIGSVSAVTLFNPYKKISDAYYEISDRTEDTVS